MTDPVAGRLLELTVTDLALIDRVRLDLAPGLNVLTGETGAGKSLLIDALGLALGMRADSSLVRHGSDLLRVEALFERDPEPLICVREVSATGRSTARVDDQAVTAARLAELTGGLVEIHGQHEQQRLLESGWQRDVLDAFGGHGAERSAVRESVARWRANRSVLAALVLEPRERDRQMEILQHEASEIAAARLRPGEADEIRARLTAAQHGEAIAAGAAALHAALLGEPGGARDALGAALHSARGLARLDPRFEALVERLAGLAGEADDIADGARSLVEDLDHDPAELARLEERLSLIFALQRRHGDDEAAVIARGEWALAELARLRDLDAERERRATEDARLLSQVAAAAAALSSLRSTAARRLATLVGDALVSLGFRPSVFDVAVGRRTAAADEPAVEIDGDALAFDATGIDDVVFRLAPNVGEPARPLARIASGGELSRVALAVKQVLAGADATPTLVFDEVDTGIGGRSADPVGRSLWLLARRHQVLCVTHLPQIAAHADAHFQIAKRDRDGRTVTEVWRLDRDGRIVELAQMLGGPADGTAAVVGARELLERAEAWRTGPAVVVDPT
jgi:DNA repair protein RecN (Recombination protein N)